ncbi:MAG TPA: SCP2 sterol-binding domain-containing protein [Rhizomicrobium sp.]
MEAKFGFGPPILGRVTRPGRLEGHSRSAANGNRGGDFQGQDTTSASFGEKQFDPGRQALQLLYPVALRAEIVRRCTAGERVISMSSEQIDRIISEMRNRVGTDSGLGGTVKLDFGESGSVFIDGKSSPNEVTDGAGKNADCTISVGLDTFEKLARRELDPTSAFMQGKLRVAGDMGLAMKLGPVLQKSASG